MSARAGAAPRRRRTLAAPPPDPFGERRRSTWCEHRQLLGGRFAFETDSQELLRIVRTAYGRLPSHRLTRRAPRFRVRLALAPAMPRPSRRRPEPAPVRALSADGILCGAMGAASFVSLSPHARSALIVVGRDTLRHAYHVRYELLEFAVYVLAARAQGLVPLHAACLGQGDTGLLLLGASGTGKSTLMLQALRGGLDLLAEDSVLVKPRGLRATGLASYLHLRPDALRFLTRGERRSLAARAAPIRRRSGVRKLEIDVRAAGYRLAAAPLAIRALVFLSARRRRGDEPLLRPLPRAQLLRRLAHQQRYAAQQPGWAAFRRRIARLPGYELCRGSHPQAAVEELRALLSGHGRRARPAP